VKSVLGAGGVADGLHVVAVGVADEGSVVALVILRPQAGLVQRLGAELHRGRVPLPDHCGRGRREGNVRLPIGAGGSLSAGDPEVGLVGAVADGHPEIHEPTVPEDTDRDDGVAQRGSRRLVAAGGELAGAGAGDHANLDSSDTIFAVHSPKKVMRSR